MSVPSKYRNIHVKLDKERLEVLSRRRALGNVFPPEEDAEEALRMARYDSFLYGPEVAARRRLMDLREKKRAADGEYGPPLTPAQETTLRFLTLLYPLPPRPNTLNTRRTNGAFGSGGRRWCGAEMLYQNVQIINGDHEPPLPFVIVDRFGMHVDLSKVVGQLWDPTVAEITWGNRTAFGLKK